MRILLPKNQVPEKQKKSLGHLMGKNVWSQMARARWFTIHRSTMANRNKDVTDNQVCSYFTDDIDLRVYFSYYFNSFGVKPINIIHFLEYFQTQTKNKKKNMLSQKACIRIIPHTVFWYFQGSTFYRFHVFPEKLRKTHTSCILHVSISIILH